MSRDIHLVDVTLRDGQQSLWALRMRTAAMLPAIGDLDAAGFDAMEFVIPGTQFVRTLRELHDDPWDWLRLGAPAVHRTPLRFHGGTSSYFATVPAVVQDLLLERLAHYKMSATRLGSPWNDYRKSRAQIARLAAHGIGVVLNLIYTVSPRHTDDYYVERMRQAVDAGPMRICFKDVGGLLTPERARRLLPRLLAQAGTIPVEFHGHCNNGFGPYNALVAADAGIRHLHCAVPPLADGSSLPSAFLLAENLAARGFDPRLDLGPLRRAAAHFTRVAKDEGLPVGTPTAYDEQLYGHQIPGGMIANLELHLRQVGLAGRLDETLAEAAAVREDLGYPIMVTPLSQFVGTQAALNVLTGTRYETVSDEIIGYAMGRWGEEAIEVMDPGVRELVLARPRAEELARRAQAPAPEPSLEEVRAAYGGVGDEELVLRVLAQAGTDALDIRDSGEVPRTYAEYWAARRPIARLLGELAQLPDGSEIRYRDARGSLVARRATRRKG